FITNPKKVVGFVFAKMCKHSNVKCPVPAGTEITATVPVLIPDALKSKEGYQIFVDLPDLDACAVAAVGGSSQ
ncbi:11220_t:CDS:1, partial [Racocetra persica]